MTEHGPFPTVSGGTSTIAQFPTCPRRGSLRSVILAQTGQDVRLCANCANCEGLTAPAMDLTIGGIIRGAARNDLRVLSCATLSACDDLLLRPIPCTAGLDLTSILITLQREAELRGLSPSPEAPPP